MAGVSVDSESGCAEGSPFVEDPSVVSAEEDLLPSNRKRILAAGASIFALLGAAFCWAPSNATLNVIDAAGFFVEEDQSDRCHVLHNVHGGGCRSHRHGKPLDLVDCKRECGKQDSCLGIEHHIKDCWLVTGNACDFRRSYHKKRGLHGRLVESRPCFDCASKYKIQRGQVFDSGRRQACGPAYMDSDDGQCKLKFVSNGEVDKCESPGTAEKAREFKAAGSATTPGPNTEEADFTPCGLVPPDGKLYFSTTVDTQPMWPTSFQYALGGGMQIPAFGLFHRLPFRDRVEREWLRQVLSNTASLGGIAYLTAEPRQGLWAISEPVAEEFAWMCAEFENQGGAGCIVRFGHEMNGDWYEWGQQPWLYKDKFRVVSQAIHRLTKRSGMMWAPTSGQGYPFVVGRSHVQPGTPDFFALDTNKDGQLNMNDDMFTPFYPGDDVVDWVGLTLTYFGPAYPYDSNQVPPPHFLVDNIRGEYGDAAHQGVPDFYEMFCGENSVHQKPFAIAETGAFWGPSLPQIHSNLEIKQSWYRQLFLDGVAAFPKLKLVMWFEKEKWEGGLTWWGSIDVDWRLLADPSIKGALQAEIFEGNHSRDNFAWQADLSAWVKESVQPPKFK